MGVEWAPQLYGNLIFHKRNVPPPIQSLLHDNYIHSSANKESINPQW